MEIKEIRIRVTNTLYKAIKARSAKEGRSMNKQIIQVMKEFLSAK